MSRIVTSLLIVFVLLTGPVLAEADPLPAWRDGPVKEAIGAWLAAVTDPAGPDFIPEAERIAVFDNDGTAACERPHGGSSAFQRELLRTFIADGKADPSVMPFSAWLEYDRDALREYGWTRAYEAMNGVFAGMTFDAYRDSALAWLGRNPHERYGVDLSDLYYLPMRQLKDLLEDHGFAVWIVTASTQEYIRSYAPEKFGVPVHRIIGTWTEGEYVSDEDGTRILRTGVQHNNGYANKPPHILSRIGQQPVFAAGNSNNDEPMLRWALAGEHRGFALWIHHDDGEREYAYDRGTDRIAGLVAGERDGHEARISRDWARLFAVETD